MFAKRLQEIREERGLSRAELGSQLELSTDIICKYERGVRMASSEILFKIADYFNVSLDYLIGRDFDNTGSTQYQVKNELDYYCSKLSEEDQIKVLEIAKSFYNLSKNK